MEYLLFGLLIAFVTISAILLIWTRPRPVKVLQWPESKEELSHVKLTNDIDVPLPALRNIDELSGDDEAAVFWGTHPSLYRRSRRT